MLQHAELLKFEHPKLDGVSADVQAAVDYDEPPEFARPIPALV